MDVNFAISVLAGIVASIVTAIAKNPKWSQRTKYIVSGIVTGAFSIVAAVVSNYVVGFPPDWQASLTRYVVIAGMVAVTAQGIYSQLKPALDALSAKTSPKVIEPAVDPSTVPYDPEHDIPAEGLSTSASGFLQFVHPRGDI